MQQTLARIEAATIEENRRMTALETAIDLLTKQVAANTSQIASASTLIKGLHQQLVDAIAAAQAAGATPGQLAQLNALQAAIKQSDDDLAAAVVEGTGASSGQVEP
jgi:predicted  nucleic acid-binding Zn-ribbon protein